MRSPCLVPLCLSVVTAQSSWPGQSSWTKWTPSPSQNPSSVSSSWSTWASTAAPSSEHPLTSSVSASTPSQSPQSPSSSWSSWVSSSAPNPQPTASTTQPVPPSWSSWTTSTKSSITLTPGALTTSCSRPVPSESRYIGLTSATTQPASTVTCHSIQASPSGDITRANAVVDAYVRSWNQYAQYCFGYDSIFVVNNTCINDFGGWGVTIVDGMDTAILMNLTDIVTAQLAHVAAIDFTTSDGKQPVNAFETTIRYLGGLLSSYDILKSGYVEPGTYNEDHVEALLQQATVLADQLQPRFDTPTGLPAGSLFWNNKTYPTDNFVNDINNVTYNASNAAVCGTIILEYYRLSDLTGDPSYRETADRAEQYLVTFGDYQPAHPYLVGSEVGLDNGEYLTYDFGWKAGIDSFLEYLAKVTIYDPSADPLYLDFFYDAVKSSIENIAVSPYNAPDLTYLTQADDCGSKEFSMDDYACFAGGTILLTARNLQYFNLSGEDAFESLALAVTESCYHLYNSTASGLGPEQWAWFDAPGHTYNESWTNNATYQASQQERGYFILNTEYNSFPESIESIWYAHRITGEQIYADWNWQIFQALVRSSDPAAGIVYSGIMDVDQPATLFEPELPSFYFAEVLKYLFLTFTDSSVISLDEWVFNTEAHPFRIGGGCVTQ